MCLGRCLVKRLYECQQLHGFIGEKRSISVCIYTDSVKIIWNGMKVLHIPINILINIFKFWEKIYHIQCVGASYILGAFI